MVKPSARTLTSAPAAPLGAPGVDEDTARTLSELAFLHEFARLATQARDWDELMLTLVERTTEALHVQVCSFYLLDHCLLYTSPSPRD